MIFTGFSPNLTTKDTLTALGYLLLPWRWFSLRKGNHIKTAKDKLHTVLGLDNMVLFDSGRSALYFALKAMGVGEGDEVIVQSYTCLVVINAIRWTGATPVYIDIDDSYNMDTDDVESHVSGNTKVIIIQHTFGTPADYKRLIEMAKRHNIQTIEDCAHALGVKHNGELLGTHADIGMFSFGADKVISSVRGGALLINKTELLEPAQIYEQKLPPFPLTSLIRHLLHLPIFWLGKKVYSLGIGKVLLYAAKKMYITNRIISDQEKQGKQSAGFPAQFPNALAHIVSNQIDTLQTTNNHRKEIAKLYEKEISNTLLQKPPYSADSIFLRYTIEVENPNDFTKKAKVQGIMMGDWYNTIIAPADINTDASMYTKGSCPQAEKHSAHSVNLPTNRHISKADAERIISFCNAYGR